MAIIKRKVIVIVPATATVRPVAITILATMLRVMIGHNYQKWS